MRNEERPAARIEMVGVGMESRTLGCERSVELLHQGGRWIEPRCNRILFDRADEQQGKQLHCATFVTALAGHSRDLARRSRKAPMFSSMVLSNKPSRLLIVLLATVGHLAHVMPPNRFARMHQRRFDAVLPDRGGSR